MFNSSKDCFLLLQNTLLTGINNVSFNSPVRENYQKMLGGATIKRKINSPQEITCKFSKSYNGKDFLQSLTGQVDMSGQFVHGTGGLDFNLATISNYSLNLDQEGFGDISVEMKIRGGIKPATFIRTGTASGDIEVINQTPTIAFLNIDSGSSAIKSINYSSSIKSVPSYEIGNTISSDTKIISPVVNDISVDMQALNQEVEDVTGLINEENFNKNVSIVFSAREDKDNAAEIAQARITAEKIKSSGVNIDDLDFGYGACAFNAYEFPKSVMKSQDIQSTAGEIINLKKDYTSYYDAKNNQNIIEHPETPISCSAQIQTVRKSLSAAFQRLSRIGFIIQNVDFENFVDGNTKINIHLLDKIREFADFEFKTTENIQNNLHISNLIKQITHFETESAPAATNTNLHILQVLLESTSFEDKVPGTFDENLFLIKSEIPKFFASTGENFEGIEKFNVVGDRKTNLVFLDKFRQINPFESEDENIETLNNNLNFLQSSLPLDLTGFESELPQPFNENLHLIDRVRMFEGFEFKQIAESNENLTFIDRVRMFEDFESVTENEINTNITFIDRVRQFEGFENDPEGNYSNNLHELDNSQFDFTDPRGDPGWKRE